MPPLTGEPEGFFEAFNWYGEGDDTDLHRRQWLPACGTGMEDYFNTAWCPADAPRRPIGVAPRRTELVGQSVLLPLPHQDPVCFRVRVTIEHGHGNRRGDDYSSTAYWYQLGTQAVPALPPVERIPAGRRRRRQ